MKIKYSILFGLLVVATFKVLAQDGNFNHIHFNTLSKSVSSTYILGWGENFNISIDSRPNPHSYMGTMMINHHTGLTLSAHSAYGGIRFYNQGYPEAYDVGTGAKMVMSVNDGRVGIGTTNPEVELDVVGGLKIQNNNNITWGGIYGPNIPTIAASTSGGLYVYPAGSSSGATMRIDQVGNVGIGTVSPKEKLSVNGKIRAHEMKVEIDNWPDYVFKEGYDVGTLEELENYIKSNKHLPEIPSAKEVENNGIALGEMNKLLLKKIEELTLHLIEKEKELNREKQINRMQNERIEKIEQVLAQIINPIKK